MQFKCQDNFVVTYVFFLFFGKHYLFIERSSLLEIGNENLYVLWAYGHEMFFNRFRPSPIIFVKESC